MEIKESYILADDWMIFIMLFSVFILAILRFRYPRRMEQLSESMLHARMARQRMKDDQLLGSNFSILLLLNFTLMISYFIFILFKYYGNNLFENYGNHLLWMVIAGVILIYLVKSVVTKIGETLFDKNYGSSEYLYNVFLFNKGLGIVLLPINICLSLVSRQIAEVFIWVSVLLIASFLLVRIFRGLRIGLENNARVLYLILYLCALEVLPTTLIVKELAGNVN